MSKSIQINTNTSSYDVIIERGILSHLKRYINNDRRVFIICDQNLKKEYLQTLTKNLSSFDVYLFNASEESKSMDSVNEILMKLAELKYTRNDLIIAFGGGVTGDLSGLVASLYMRGLEYIQIPTTTLSQIDSSVGGKVAVNFNGIKNLVGAFYHPQVVLIDPLVLNTLDDKNYFAGVIEGLKMGITSNKYLYNLIVNNDIKDNIDEIIYESIKTKAKVVEADEFDTGTRNILNFGHTLGHAIEAKYKIIHGHAIYIGMLHGFISETIKDDLLSLNDVFNVDLDLVIDESLMDYILSDKKLITNSINMVEVLTVGNGKLKKVSIESLKELLNE